MILLIAIFSFLVFRYFKGKSLSLLFSAIILVSLILGNFIGREIEIEGISDLLFLILLAILIIAIIAPWKTYININEVIPIDNKKFSLLSKFLIIANIFIFIIFAITTYVVVTSITDINEFKYGEGVSTDFYYNYLPFNVTLFNIAILIYYLAYFIFPLHFFYLYKKKYGMAILCFILSLNIVLYGLTFFSRAVVIQYLLMYLGMFWMLKNVVDTKVKKAIKFVSIILGVGALIYFIDVSAKRFNDNNASMANYNRLIPKESPVQDVVLYSYLDYSSQWVFNGHEIMKKYNGDNFAGKLTFNSILTILGQFGIISYDADEYKKERRNLWPDRYSYSFNGYSAYTLYDYGLIGAFIFSFGYFLVVRKVRPKNNSITLKDLFLIVFLIQIPLMAIFYSQMGVIIIGLLIWVPFNAYLKYNLK